MASMYQVKGSHVAVAQRWVDEHLGEGAFSTRAASIGAGCSSIILPGSLYDAEPLCDVLTWASTRTGRPVREAVAEIASRNAREDLATIYRVFLRLASPVRLLGMTPMIWQNYVKFGTSSTIRNVPGHFIGESVGVPAGLFEWAVGAWCGFLPEAITMAGGKRPSARLVESSPVPDGTIRFRIEIRYAT